MDGRKPGGVVFDTEVIPIQADYRCFAQICGETRSNRLLVTFLKRP